MRAHVTATGLWLASFAGLVTSCSILTTWDGLGSGGGATTGASGGAAGSGGQGGGGRGGASAGGGGAGTGGDASVDAPDSGKCTAGGAYCGGDKVMGNSNTLYLCHADGSATVVEVCAYGCTIRPAGQDDMCRCKTGGYYCGGDKIVGDPDTLYRCKSDGSGTLVMHCSNGCTIVPGQDDHCG